MEDLVKTSVWMGDGTKKLEGWKLTVKEKKKLRK
jgi:hypothetical protein